MKNFITTLFLSLLIMSCSSDDTIDPPKVEETPEESETPIIGDTDDDSDTEDDENSNTNRKKLASIESSYDNGDTFWIANYDSSNRPTTSYDDKDRLVHEFSYEHSDHYMPIRKDIYSAGTLISSATYIYDDSNRLIQHLTGTVASNRTFEYDTNTIIIRFESLPNHYTKLFLDNLNRLSKIEEHDEEDSNDNITAIIDFEYENNNLIQIRKEDVIYGLNSYTSNYTFDDKQNPFYNQFEEYNINYILESSFDLEQRVLQIFSKNNYISNSLEESSRTLEYTSDDYPSTINFTYKDYYNQVTLENYNYQN
ncbi:hypothetical protein ACE939_15005 [Aquimarina sp. W85]|uniref:hypothetical protein n=1 Tax=Aquimarina rhodophyticola TaxID=3342246 RepID=UPI00366A7D9E